MKVKTKYQHRITYIYYLATYVISIWLISFAFFYLIFSYNPLLAYLGNVFFVFGILAEEKMIGEAKEFLYNKLQKETFIKKYLRKQLAIERHKPSVKSALYFYYIICLIVGRVLILDDGTIFGNIRIIQESRDYFTGIYYVLILLVAADKFKEHFTKEKKHRDKYYAQYEEELIQ